MVTIDISIEDISRLMGFDTALDVETLDQYMALAISEVDSEPEGPDENGHTKVSIDIKTSNRPDLWSAEGLARLVKGHLDSPGLPSLDAEPSGYEINVDPELRNIRPYIAAAVVRNLKLDDFMIKQMIQIQDKNDFSFGRKRKRTSIGIYNINMLVSPIQYKLVDRSFKFVPLQFEEELTVDEIFEKHPKGIEYRSILDKYKQVPMLVDKNGLVLSMPPIINSNDVGRVTEQTTDVLVETTGNSHDATLVALSVIVQALRDRGGIVESVQINYPEDYSASPEVTPETKLIQMEVDQDEINTYLGTDFSSQDMIELLRKRRNEAVLKNGKLIVSAAPWRKDIKHWVDISEEIAMAAEYNKLDPTDANVVTAGKLDPSTEDENMIRQLLIGHQLIEVMNYTLTDPEIITTKVGRNAEYIEKNCIELANPVTSTYSVVRPEILPVLLEFASKNTHVDYPQRIFETGEVVIKNLLEIITKTHACVLLAGANETYETILSILDSMMNLLKMEYELKESSLDLFIPGRRAYIYVGKTKIGYLGEVHPLIINNYGIEVPLAAFELDLSSFPNLRNRRLITDEN